MSGKVPKGRRNRAIPGPVGRVLVALLLIALACLLLRPAPTEPARDARDDALEHAVVANGRLWLLTEAGRLSSIALNGDARVPEPLPEPVLDLCVLSDRSLLTASGPSPDSTWSLRQRTGGTWKIVAEVLAEGDFLLGMLCDQHRATLVTTRRIIDVGDARWSEVTLSPPPRLRGRVTTIAGTSAYLFIGMDRGEWGGGLLRINRSSGRTIRIGCDGEEHGLYISAELICRPVHGIAAVPWRPGCVVASVGLAHLGSRDGLIAEVCGQRVTTLFSQPDCPEPTAMSGGRVGCRDTVMFFELQRIGDAVWAISTDGLWRLDADGIAKLEALPRFETIGDLTVSFALRDFVLLLKPSHRYTAMSGAVPMLVPR